jgi:alkylation response protein AidB-like acyl-CoA dehydrogenase
MPVWSEQERMIADSASDFFKAHGSTDRIRQRRHLNAHDRDTWQNIADQGWIGMLISESEGGLGFDLREALVLMQQTSRFLAIEPLAGAIAVGQALAALPSLRKVRAEAILGTCVVLPAWGAIAANNGKLNGHSDPLSGLNAADSVLLFDRASQGVFLVDRSMDGLVMDAAPTIDGGDVGRLFLHDVRAEQISGGASVRNLSQAVRDTRLILEAAELCGIGSEVLRRVRAYLEARKQFGVALASFQAVQQRIASVHVLVAAAEALLFEAARAFEGTKQSFAARAAFYRAGQAAHVACREAIQFHGAIGFTDEFDVGLYLKRCLAITAAQGGLEAVRSEIAN